MAVPSEIAILKKETFNGWYKLRTYYLATIAVMAPIHVINSLFPKPLAIFATNEHFFAPFLFFFCR